MLFTKHLLLHNSTSLSPKISGRKTWEKQQEGTQKHWHIVERYLKAFASNISYYLIFSLESFHSFFDSKEHNFPCIYTVCNAEKPFFNCFHGNQTYSMYLIVAFSSIIYYCSWSQHVLLLSKLWIPWSLSGIHYKFKFAFNNLECKEFNVFYYVVSH